MINIFGEEEFKPVVRYQREIPGYYVSMDGRIYSEKTNMIRSATKSYDYNSTGKKRSKNHIVTLDIPIGHYPDYSFRKRRKTDNSELITISVHRVVMETWKPIDKNPPIPKEDWDICPESAKQWIRDTAIVDHKDDNPSNNHVDNLQWVIPKDNEPNRKKRDQSS